MDRARSSRLGWRTVAKGRGFGIALVVAVAVTVPVGFAIAQSVGNDQSPAPVPSSAFSPGEVDQATATRAAADRAAAGSPSPVVQAQGETNYIPATPVPKELRERCRALLAEDPANFGCEVVVAVADGRVPPGEYSDDELKAEMEK